MALSKFLLSTAPKFTLYSLLAVTPGALPASTIDDLWFIDRSQGLAFLDRGGEIGIVYGSDKQAGGTAATGMATRSQGSTNPDSDGRLNTAMMSSAVLSQASAERYADVDSSLSGAGRGETASRRAPASQELFLGDPSLGFSLSGTSGDSLRVMNGGDTGAGGGSAAAARSGASSSTGHQGVNTLMACYGPDCESASVVPASLDTTSGAGASGSGSSSGNNNNSSSNGIGGSDAVMLAAVVVPANLDAPEPGGWLLLGVALMSFGLMGRKKGAVKP